MTALPEHRRRYPTFSLRTFFVTLTACAVWLGIIVHQAREQREAVKAIETLDASVSYDWGFTDPRRPSGPDWLRRIVGDDYFQTATVVSIWTPEPVTHSDVMRLVPHLQRLRSLRLVNILWPVREETLRELNAALPSCKVVVWSDRDIPEEIVIGRPSYRPLSPLSSPSCTISTGGLTGQAVWEQMWRRSRPQAETEGVPTPFSRYSPPSRPR